MHLGGRRFSRDDGYDTGRSLVCTYIFKLKSDSKALVFLLCAALIVPVVFYLYDKIC